MRYIKTLGRICLCYLHYCLETDIFTKVLILTYLNFIEFNEKKIPRQYFLFSEITLSPSYSLFQAFG